MHLPFDVFLSHSSIDKPWVRRLKADLACYQVRAWLDEDEIRPGNLFVSDLEQALDHCRAVALIVSAEALVSGWVKEEYARAVALTQRKDPPLQLIPVLYRKAELPGFLANRTWVDFRDETAYDQNVWKLVWGITGVKPPAVLPLQAGHTRPVETLPLDALPDPAPLPPGSRMPYPPNPLFVGREQELRALARALKPGGTAAIGQAHDRLAAATGLGGIGKSQLACEFAHRYGQFFAGGVFWLSLADPAAVPAEIAACGGPGSLGLYGDADGLKLDEQVARVQRAWLEPTPRLLIFDNCEDERLLAQWRPAGGGCRVLVTSRRAEYDPGLGVTVYRLGVLPRQQSIELLLKFFTSPLGPLSCEGGWGGEVLDALAAELGDLPLALHLAGSFLKAYRHDLAPAAYLAELRAGALLEHESLQGVDLTYSPTNHDLHVGRTFALSYNRLDPADPADALALALLARAACFAPGEAIPRGLLLLTVELPDKAAQRRASKALKRLVDLGLLEEGENGAVTLHRLLARFVQQVSNIAEAQAAVEEALLVEANRLNNAGYPAPLLAWQPHLRVVTDIAQEQENERAGGLCNTLAFHLQMMGEYAAARPYYERALAIREKVLGPEHPGTALSLNNLGALLRMMGEYAAARPYYERALAIREKVLGPEHPNTALSLRNLGDLLRMQGDYVAARPYFDRALAIWEKVLGPEHPNTATSLNDLGALLRMMGEYAAARPYYERALAIREKVLGPEHPNTALSLRNLGDLLRMQGDYVAARPYFDRALAIWEKVLGPEHPDTATSLNDLGALLDSMGEYAAALSYFERALTIQQKVLGETHPDTATSLWWIGMLLARAGEIEQARLQLGRALAIFEQRLGPEHPNTRGVRGSLAGLRGSLNH